MRNSLEVQWLGLLTSTAGGTGSIPGQGNKIQQPKRCSQKKNKKKKKPHKTLEELTREVAMNGKADASGSLQGQVVQEHGSSNGEPPTTPQFRPWLYQVKAS